MTLVVARQLSVVAPCYDEQDALPEFIRRVGAVLDALGGTSEIVLSTTVPATGPGKSWLRRQRRIRALLACG